MSVASQISLVIALLVLIGAIAWEPISEFLGIATPSVSYADIPDAGAAMSADEYARTGTCPFGYAGPGSGASGEEVRWVESPSDSAVRFPVIDVTAFRAAGTGDAQLPPGHMAQVQAKRARVAAAVADAAASTGFFFVSGHGLSAADRAAILKASRDFFALSPAVKTGIPIKSGGFTRGYVALGGESGSHRLEVKEAFSYGYAWPQDRAPANALTGPNVWPPHDTPRLSVGWRDALTTFYSQMVGVAELVVQALGTALEYPDLPAQTTRGAEISLMRLFHYWPYAHAEKADARHAANSNERIGSSPHTDWGFLTLIVQDDVGGLQLFTDLNMTDAARARAATSDARPGSAPAAHERIGRWVDIPAVPDAVVLNCGDYLSLLTGGAFKSPLHRVTTGAEERYSAVFFYYPNFEAKIAPLNLPTRRPAAAAGAAEQGYSLLANQHADHQAAAAAPAPPSNAAVEDAARLGSLATPAAPAATATDLSTTAFGDYIAAKWAQVHRRADKTIY